MASGGVLRFVAFRLARKNVSMEAFKKHARATARASAEIRTPVQSLVARSRPTRRTGGASFDMKSGAAEST
jgi:hypothetical protein